VALITLRYGAFLLAAYGIVMDGLMPVLTAIFRHQPVLRALWQGSPAWIPLACIGALTTQRTRTSLRLIAFLAGLGLLFYAGAGLHMVLDGSIIRGFGVFRHVYYGGWSVLVFSITLAVVSSSRVRQLFRPDDEPHVPPAP